VDDPSVRVNYDTGNSCSLGYDPREEIAAYGARLGSVHIKDRGHGSGTVALGTGDTDFETIFVELSRLRYQGSFILQAARGQTGGECAHFRRNVTLARQMIHSQPQPARRQ
jgi:hexulose-6-phosphate isomerase